MRKTKTTAGIRMSLNLPSIPDEVGRNNAKSQVTRYTYVYIVPVSESEERTTFVLDLRPVGSAVFKINIYLNFKHAIGLTALALGSVYLL